MKRDLSGARVDAVPVEGRPAGLRFDGQVTYLWWGQDLDDQDCVATRAGRLLTFATEAGCWAAAEVTGWSSCMDRSDAAPVAVLDLEPAQQWLRGQRVTLDPRSGLDLWNVAADVAYSTGRSWRDRGGLRDRCYDKLVAASVPWAWGLRAYHPTWAPRQLRAVRAVLGQAVHVLRATMRA